MRRSHCIGAQCSACILQDLYILAVLHVILVVVITQKTLTVGKTHNKKAAYCDFEIISDMYNII